MLYLEHSFGAATLRHTNKNFYSPSHFMRMALRIAESALCAVRPTKSPSSDWLAFRTDAWMDNQIKECQSLLLPHVCVLSMLTNHYPLQLIQFNDRVPISGCSLNVYDSCRV